MIGTHDCTLQLVCGSHLAGTLVLGRGGEVLSCGCWRFRKCYLVSVLAITNGRVREEKVYCSWCTKVLSSCCTKVLSYTIDEINALLATQTM